MWIIEFIEKNRILDDGGLLYTMNMGTKDRPSINDKVVINEIMYEVKDVILNYDDYFIKVLVEKV